MSLVLAEVAKSIKNAVVHKKFRRKERINYMFEENLEERTPSNNTTRQLYTLLLERLYRCDNDIVFDLLFDLLNRKKYSQKIKKRIIDVMESDCAYNLWQ